MIEGILHQLTRVSIFRKLYRIYHCINWMQWMQWMQWMHCIHTYKSQKLNAVHPVPTKTGCSASSQYLLKLDIVDIEKVKSRCRRRPSVEAETIQNCWYVNCQLFVIFCVLILWYKQIFQFFRKIWFFIEFLEKKVR
jgi:hypothetical protein